ncbi:hypothetical protein [Streptomyces sp. NBC_00470]|uniref:hypothetical protein n=1 Tax=Streptomyces sp. NBC_00470 TaxID=2975753 RepID=UPI0030E3F4AB
MTAPHYTVEAHALARLVAVAAFVAQGRERLEETGAYPVATAQAALTQLEADGTLSALGISE